MLERHALSKIHPAVTAAEKEFDDILIAFWKVYLARRDGETQLKYKLIANEPSIRRAIQTGQWGGGPRVGTNTQERKSLESLPRRQGGIAGVARRGHGGDAGRIRVHHGAFGLRQVDAFASDRWTGAGNARKGVAGRERPHGFERLRQDAAASAQSWIRLSKIQSAAHPGRLSQHRSGAAYSREWF